MKKYLSILLISIASVAGFSPASGFDVISLGPIFDPEPSSNLCNVSCNLTIGFPDGGTLTATERLTITFGNGGEINLGATGVINAAIQPRSLSPVGGEAFTLEAGESISFDVGGFINTGTTGNLDYTNIEVTTDVNIDAVLGYGSTQINLFDIAATGTGVVQISTNGIINVVGLLSSTEAGFNLSGIVPDFLPRLCDVSCDLTISFPDGGSQNLDHGGWFY